DYYCYSSGSSGNYGLF
nr:immunoglobulin light chain junction region [Macaca mulatta]MOX33249.1 immunoglobulin light chain junction region [Macaca mulatta]MOX33421.1 immunoglobulin light chain junction region [Macaca mulatta]MOX33531.1 immunoglobulin light chain junction region [Macaca mulatta]MOX33858.1 immunoglobulin light chain junction region [Macaca mulatta]